MRGSGNKTKASVAAALRDDPIELGSSDGEHIEPRSAATAKLSGSLASGPLCQNIYNKACKCKKDNPNCLTGIIPGPSSFRKKGLWQKDTKALLAQGHDPNDDLKEVSFLAKSHQLLLADHFWVLLCKTTDAPVSKTVANKF